MVSIKCPKCQKVFTHPKYLSKAQEHLDRHLTRKNPCDGSEPKFVFERKKTSKVPSIDSLDLTGIVETLDGNIRFVHVISHIFKELNERNQFAVWPNVKHNEVYYMNGETSACAPFGGFMVEFWNRVLITQICPLLSEHWPRYLKFTEWFTGPENVWVYSLRQIDQNNVTRVNEFLKSKFYKSTKSAIMSHLKNVPKDQRFKTRVNMGVEVPETRSIMYVAPVRCSLNTCMGVAVKYGVCEKHVNIWERTYLFPKEEGRNSEPAPTASI